MGEVFTLMSTIVNITINGELGNREDGLFLYLLNHGLFVVLPLVSYPYNEERSVNADTTNPGESN